MKYHVFVAYTLCIAFGFTTSSVHADSYTENANSNIENNDVLAREYLQKGIETYNEGRYEEAANAFTEAHRLKPSWKILYNIGQSNAAAKRYGLALESFEKYLVEGGDEVAPVRADEIRLEIENLKSKIGYVTVTPQRKAKLFVDDTPRGELPLSGPVAVNATQEHIIRIEYDNGQRLEKRVRVPSGQTAKIDLSESSQVATPPPPPKGVTTIAIQPDDDSHVSPSPEGSSLNKNYRVLQFAGISSLGVGGAMLIAGAITGGLSLRANSNLKDKCPDNTCYSDNYDDLDEMNHLALAGTALLVAGSVAVSAGLGLILLKKYKVSGKESMSLTMAPVPNGLFISGAF